MTEEVFIKDSQKEEITDISETTEFPYMDRELSWLKFNHRVLDLATLGHIPLLERVKFLSIANSNLDEFFTIRIASRLNDNNEVDEIMGDMGEEENRNTVKEILNQSKDMLLRIDKVYVELKEILNKEGITIHDSVSEDNIDPSMNEKLEKYFLKSIFPALTPLTIDTTRPLPHLKPFSIYIALIINIDGEEKIGLVEIPPQLSRMVSFNKKKDWYFIEDIVIANMKYLYPGIEYYDITAFRILRDGDLTVNENLTFHEADYVESMISHVRSRILYNEPVRVDIWGEPRKKIVKLLKDSLDISKKFIFYTDTRLKMSDLMEIYNKIDTPEYKYPPFEPAKPFKDKPSMLKLISKQDVVVHHPYDDFNDSVLRFVAEACTDPYVISIKQTLYRSGNNSKILNYLVKAAEAGKKVVVVMEIKARFDEETNIEWAEKLKKAGATVVYGYEHIKTHAKMMHVFRVKDGEPQQFVHIGTGNYSEKNSKVYTDIGYFTSDRKVCQDVSNIFNMITGGIITDAVALNHIKISPIATRKFLYEMIDDQIKKGPEGYIFIKVNNIADMELTKKLYEASQAGVMIDIVCRSSCSVVPNVEGVSKTIRVKSIVGRFLEHSRILMFGRQNEADSRIFITSSDLMTRNLDRRLEVLFEVTDVNAKIDIRNYIDITLADVANCYDMDENGNYNRILFNSEYQYFDSHERLQNYRRNDY